MSRPAIFFLTIITPFLALLLAWLGLVTLRTNPLGGFLLIVGIIYSAGVVYLYWIRRNQSWASGAGGAVVGEERGDHSFWLIALGMASAFYASPVEYGFFPALLPRAVWAKAFGVVLVISGFALFIWARRAMKAFYSGHINVTEAQPLVQSGPYRLIRHPAYAGFLLMALGIVLGYSSLVGLAAVLLLLLPGLAWRIRVEESLLEAHFGPQWQAYCDRVPAMLPRFKMRG